MEKHTPHCRLSEIKSRVRAGQIRTTRSAREGASLLGLGLDDILAVLINLTPADFRKSMTTHADHTVWQDVYAPQTAAGRVYLKLTVLDGMLVVSFKAL